MLIAPEWERLADSLRRVEKAGLSENEAKVFLCNAMTSGTVAVRFMPAFWRSKGTSGARISPNIFVSPQLRPDDLDWAHSRPLNRSSIGPAAGLSGAWREQDAVTIQLSADDVNDLLGGGVNEYPRDAETEAIDALALLLKEKPTLRRADARAWCDEKGFKLSGRAFQYRVWPSARERAGLGRKAPPGPKPKSFR
jgi:hypothetical protein